MGALRARGWALGLGLAAALSGSLALGQEAVDLPVPDEAPAFVLNDGEAARPSRPSAQEVAAAPVADVLLPDPPEAPLQLDFVEPTRTAAIASAAPEPPPSP